MSTDAPFTGFQSPTSNTTYTPNQFFDVVLPVASRGVVRLVAYMLRKTLGWSDAEGNPQEARIMLSYRELEIHAGIAQSKIRAALDEAVAAHFIRCIRPGQSHLEGSQGQSALYELCWDERETYLTDPEDFHGFFAGNGNLTCIPNEFFDVLIPGEPLAVIKVVGAIIRHTIGFQTRYGMRRQQIVMSFTEIQRKTGIVSRRSVNEALHLALDHRYLRVIETGYFDPNAGQNSRAATYGVHWRESVQPAADTVPLCPAETFSDADASKRIPEERLQKDTGGTPPKGYRERLQKDTGNASKRIPGTPPKGYRLINDSLNNILNTQQQPFSTETEKNAVAAGESPLLTMLLSVGFDSHTAAQLVEHFPAERIEQQMRWLPLRAANRNRLGLLRRAIEENWQQPEGAAPVPSERADLLCADRFVRYFYAGLAGNPGEPVASPSANDLSAATPYVSRLLALWPEETRVAAWGREFGAFVQTSEQNTGKMPRSFVVALRACGDAYYLEFRTRRQRVTRQTTEEQRRRHETRFKPAYEAYLSGQEAVLQQEQPTLWAAFVQTETEARQALETSTCVQGPLVRIQLRAFDTADERRQRLRAFFRDIPAAGMVDFQEWDARYNC